MLFGPRALIGTISNIAFLISSYVIGSLNLYQRDAGRLGKDPFDLLLACATFSLLKRFIQWKDPMEILAISLFFL